MNYSETLEWLFARLPMFQRIGKAAFKKDLNNTLHFCAHLGNPHQQFRSIHIAGTNGKGSSSHFLASIFQEAGYKTGLYTSPHLRSFTERIRINGKEISEEKVVQFVAENRAFIEELAPSFFEVTVCMAFWEFANEKVDIAIIETGLGGRLDSTNVILPELSLITNIGFDHMDLLGETLPQIAGEKAGIIKPNIPVVISETHPETAPVFRKTAQKKNSPIVFADEKWQAKKEGNGWKITDILQQTTKTYSLGLSGTYQERNLPGVLETCRQINEKTDYRLTEEDIEKGLARVTENTGIRGRWEIISASNPQIICDVGHNADGLKWVLENIASTPYQHLHFVFGTVKDKDVAKVLAMLPKEATYYFCQARVPRALEVEELKNLSQPFGLHGSFSHSVEEACKKALESAAADDLVFIGGSTFVVAEIPDWIYNRNLKQ